MFPLPIIGAVLLASVVGFTGGMGLMRTIKNTDIAELKTAHAEQDATASKVALADLQTASAAIKNAAEKYAVTKDELGLTFETLRKELKNAKPLPAGCRPDDVRVRHLNTAVDAANKTAAR